MKRGHETQGVVEIPSPASYLIDREFLAPVEFTMKPNPKKTVARLSATKTRHPSTKIHVLPKEVERTVVHDFIDHKWTNKPQPRPVFNDGYKRASPWQKKCYAKLRGDVYRKIKAPTGSGKSTVMQFFAMYDLVTDLKIRVLVIVPQGILGYNFAEARFIMPDSQRKVSWKPKHNCCAFAAEGIVDRVVDFIKNGKGDANDRVMICTHPAAVEAFKRIKASGETRRLKNLSVFVDEAHHIMNASVEDSKKAVISNGLGEFVKHLTSNGKNNKLTLATASFFRGDRSTILTKEMDAKFTTFDLPCDEYLESMTHLESFSFKFVLCGRDYLEAIEQLMESKRCKDIIYIPRPNAKDSFGCKYGQVDRIVGGAERIYNGSARVTEQGVVNVEGRRRTFKILDLVDEHERDVKKEFVSTINRDPDAVDAIVALGMCKEGFDWIHANRAIIVGVRQSLVDVVQMIGRLFRDTPDKNHVEVVQLLPWTLDQVDKAGFRENLNNFLKTVYAAMILKNILLPVRIQNPNKKQVPNRNPEAHQTPLSMLVDDDVSNEIIKRSAEAVVSLVEGVDPEAGTEDFVNVISDLLDEYGIPSDESNHVANFILKKISNCNLGRAFIDAKDIKFDFVRASSNGDFVSAKTDADKLKEFRVVLDAGVQDFVPPSRYVKAFDSWAKDNLDAYGICRTKHAFDRWLKDKCPVAV